MPSERQLSEVLSEFARTMLTDFPIQAILDHLVRRIEEVLPITAAGVTLISPDTDPAFPRFAPRALAAGLAAAFTFPMRSRNDRLGALDLYRDAPGGLDPSDMLAAQTLADVAAAYLLNARARTDLLALAWPWPRNRARARCTIPSPGWRTGA